MGDARAARNVLEPLARQIAQQAFRQERAIIARASGEIEIGPAVVVEITGDAAGRVEDMIQMRLRGDIAEMPPSL